MSRLCKARSPVRSAVLALALAAVGCTESSSDAITLTQNANRRLAGSEVAGIGKRGGLEFASVRADIKAQYEEAIRLVQSLPADDADRNWVLAHAHFGLGLTRLWDLAERVERIFAENGVLTALRGEESLDEIESGRPSFCALFDNFTALQSIAELLVETALLPVIDDFTAALAADSRLPDARKLDFEIVAARYDLSAFTTERTSQSYFDLSGRYSAPDVALLLGAVELLTGAFDMMFAYRELFGTLFLFSFVSENPIGGHPSKLYNSNPCAEYPTDGNPLLSATFGTLVEDGQVILERARLRLVSGLGHIAAALENAVVSNPQAHWIGDSGSEWGTGIVELSDGSPRFEIRLPNRDTPLTSLDNLFKTLTFFIQGVTPVLSPQVAAEAVRDIQSALAGPGRWRVRATLNRIVEPLGGLAALVNAFGGLDTSRVPDLADLALPYIDFAQLFVAAPGDLKLLFPQYYLEDEPFEDVDGDGRRTPREPGLLIRGEGDFSNAEGFTDLNCNGRWDQRGDFVVAEELEPFVDANANRVYDGTEISPLGGVIAPEQLGLIGAFLDVDADGAPDRPNIDGPQSAGNADGIVCGPNAGIAWPASHQDPDFAQYGSLLLGPASVTAPFGFPITTNATFAEDRYTGPTAQGNDADVLGLVVGHYWPPRVFDVDSRWPESARRDPANGVYDRDYLFFTDPTLRGIIVRDLDGGAEAGATDNAWLNRLLTQWSDLAAAIGF